MDRHEKNKKKFDLYVFLSSFARGLIEVFIPLILFKYGYSLKEVIGYFFIYNLIELLLAYPLEVLASKKGNKILVIIGFIFFILVNLVLNNMYKSTSYLLLVAFLFATYRITYWLSRRYYNLK